MEKRKPNFFIVGAARAGTTSLWQYLKTHPEICMPENELKKEPSYFSDYGKHLGLSKYLSFFKHANHNHKWVGEASVAYLTDSESAKSIYEFNPSAKIIIMLRNPASRAYSLYNWMAQDGYEYASSFEEALKLEQTRMHQKESDWYKPNYYWGYLYFRSGLYYDQVKRYLELFKGNVLIIKFEDFVRAPRSSYREVCSFFQITPMSVPYHIYNPSHAVRSAKILFILRKLNNDIIRKNKQGVPANKICEEFEGMYKEIVVKLSRVTRLSIYEGILGRVILKRIKEYLGNLSNQFPYEKFRKKEERDRLLNFGLRAGRPAKLKKKIRKNLLKKYEPNIKRLSDLTGIDFLDWLI